MSLLLTGTVTLLRVQSLVLLLPPLSLYQLLLDRPRSMARAVVLLASLASDSRVPMVFLSAALLLDTAVTRTLTVVLAATRSSGNAAPSRLLLRARPQPLLCPLFPSRPPPLESVAPPLARLARASLLGVSRLSAARNTDTVETL
jgi:hypothetical protein